MATIQPGGRFVIDSDPFSDTCGRALCADCRERWYDWHVCPTDCTACGKKVYKHELHRHCCKHPEDSLAPWDQLDIRLVSNGQRNYYRRCRDCGHNVPIKNAMLPGWAKTAEPHRDYTNDAHPCARCDNTLTEYHHFAPGAIFADSHLWPGAWLCKACHTLWHRAMRESAGYRLHDKQFCDWADDERRAWPQWGSAVPFGMTS